MILTPEQTKRFWSQVDRKGIKECWLWQGALYGDMGYGRIRINYKSYPAHRISYLLIFGEMPNPDLDTCHSCDTPACVNPYHISECTRRQNMQQAALRGRINTQKLRIEDVLAIRASPVKQSLLAKRFGVTEPTISKIKSRKTWDFDIGELDISHDILLTLDQ